MLFYKVNKDCDNKKVYHFKRGRWCYDGIIVGNELYTQKEYSRLMEFSNLHSSYFTPVNVKKNKTVWFFGARFEFAEA